MIWLFVFMPADPLNRKVESVYWGILIGRDASNRGSRTIGAYWKIEYPKRAWGTEIKSQATAELIEVTSSQLVYGFALANT